MEISFGVWAMDFRTIHDSKTVKNSNILNRFPVNFKRFNLKSFLLLVCGYLHTYLSVCVMWNARVLLSQGSTYTQFDSSLSSHKGAIDSVIIILACPRIIPRFASMGVLWYLRFHENTAKPSHIHYSFINIRVYLRHTIYHKQHLLIGERKSSCE